MCTTVDDLKQLILSSGIQLEDKRLKISELEKNAKHENQTTEEQVIKNEMKYNVLLNNIVKGNLVIPNWEHFSNTIDEIYETIKKNTGGTVADYIPELANVDPDLLCVVIVTVDGQIYMRGNLDASFSVQSCSKPVTYAIAFENNGEKYVHNFIASEPSGRGFNDLCLTDDGIPHNPLINTGAIMATSLIKYRDSPAERYKYITQYWEKMIGEKVGFNNPIYLSEKNSADRNHLLSYMLQGTKAFQYGKDQTTKLYQRDWNEQDRLNTLELYFQSCSIECTTKQIATLASTFANGGVNVFTGGFAFKQENVKNTLALMYSCGLYDYSGEWSRVIGIPAKSGVSGIIYGVIPNVMGIAVYSPKLDHIGNSVRGVHFFKEFVEKYSTHIFDNATNTKEPLTKKEYYSKNFNTYLLLEASGRGDLHTVNKLLSEKVNINSCDYDNRTALHVACSTGNTEIVKLLLKSGADTTLIDSWKNTAYNDAERYGYDAILALFENDQLSPSNPNKRRSTDDDFFESKRSK